MKYGFGCKLKSLAIYPVVSIKLFPQIDAFWYHCSKLLKTLYDNSAADDFEHILSKNGKSLKLNGCPMTKRWKDCVKRLLVLSNFFFCHYVFK